MSCMSPYSMPLWTILTKCPAPSGPTQSQQGVPSATLAAMAWKIAPRRDGQASLGFPPGMMRGPVRAPLPPRPKLPAPMNTQALRRRAAGFARRTESSE